MTHPSPTSELDAIRKRHEVLAKAMEPSLWTCLERERAWLLTHIAALEAELADAVRARDEWETQSENQCRDRERYRDVLVLLCAAPPEITRKAMASVAYDTVFNLIPKEVAEFQLVERSKAEAQLATRLPTEAQISYLLEVLAREGVANAGGDFMRRKISKAILALLSGAATPAPTAALTEEELLTPELIKKAADAGERVGWDDVLTPNAQIYHRAIDLKKYETALRAVLPIIIDRLAKSPPQGAEE